MNKRCSIPSCEKDALAKGWCTKHYTRWRRHGRTDQIKKLPNGTIGEWIEKHINFSEDDCLIWPFYRQSDGYPRMNGGVPARLICKKRHGPPPTNKHHAAHRCGNGAGGCVNPTHLYWATPKQNAADRIEHGTQHRGEKTPNARLTVQQVRQIRALSGSMERFRIAALYDVSSGCTHGVLSGKNWKHVK